MRILVSGASGLVGRALSQALVKSGHEVSRLVRSEPESSSSSIVWNPDQGFDDPSVLNGIEVVIHLAGENLSSKRWTNAQKKRIRDSRIIGTSNLAKTLALLSPRPKAFLSASAVGIYGNRGDELLSEESVTGTGFLAQVCIEWERACDVAELAGIRVVNLRFGVVLSKEGGALQKMLTPFLLGVGGKLGSGRQYMSWIGISDTVRAIEHVLADESYLGPVNIVAPNPITNAEFTRALGLVVQRPTLFGVPAFAARLAFGEMANEALLSSTRAHPTKLLASGFAFTHPGIEEALRAAIGR